VATFPKYAQAQNDASLNGSVVDASGAGVEGARILITSLETGAQRQLVTDADGAFHAPSLLVGNYEVSAEKAGFRPEKRSGIVLVVGQREELRLILQVGDVRQTVEVTSNALLITSSTEDTSGLVGERQVKDLPLNGRSYDQLLTLNPGTINYTSQRAGG